MKSPLRILLIEDDEDDYLLTRSFLSQVEGSSHELDWVSTYEEGLEDLRAGRHDLYLLDYRLGNRTGLDLLREVGERSPRAPIIFLTGQGDRQVDLEAMRAGAVDYLSKNRLDASRLERSIRYAWEHFQNSEALRAALEAAEAARKQMQEANMAKGRFLATMSHEFRTPLHSILGFSELLLEDAPTAEDREYAQNIQQSGRHLLNLVNDLLDLSRIQAGHLELDRSIVNLGLAVNSACDCLQALARARGVGLEVPPTSLGELWVDPVRLHQILLNLLSNAVKFTPPGGTVRVEVTREPRAVRIAVHDTGVGISPEDQARIFQPYVRAGTRLEPGAGLGLAIVRLLVEAHGGSVEVESEPGKGSCFSVVLPDERPT